MLNGGLATGVNDWLKSVELKAGGIGPHPHFNPALPAA